MSRGDYGPFPFWLLLAMGTTSAYVLNAEAEAEAEAERAAKRKSAARKRTRRSRVHSTSTRR
jgi:hypothetical protein